MKNILLFILVQLMVFEVSSQDIHWSQFNVNPIFQNPANAGHFKGDYRFVGNYRDQWRSVTAPFQTLSLSTDSRIAKYQNIGYGISFFHDVEGDGKFRTVELQGNISYHLRLTSDSMHNVRLGANFGLNHRQFNVDQFYFDNQYNGIAYDPSIATGESFQTSKRSNLSVGIGASYQYYINERLNFTGGMGAFNLNRPKQGFLSDAIRREIRLNFFGRGIYKLNYDFDLVPGINLNFQGKYKEIVLGSSVKYTLVDRLGEYRAVYAGLWWRNRDAAFLSLGMDYQSWFVGVSYDVNFSKLVPASKVRGGLEIAVRYIMYRFKPKKVAHRICPDYI